MPRLVPIPRFLLPRWQWHQARTYSTPPPQLAKPTKFTPPSHPSRRFADPVNYPGPAIKQDPKKHYPNTMPPPDTWAHYFLTSRSLHFYLSLGILASLATTISISNFLAFSPEAQDFEWRWADPMGSLGSFSAAWKASVGARSQRTAEMRRKKVEDMEKRGEYRRAHGLDQPSKEGMFAGFGRFGVKTPEEDKRAEGQLLIARTVLDRDAAQKGGQAAGWVDDEMRKLEEEAATGGTQKAQAPRAVVVNAEEKKKSSWKLW